MRVTSSPNAAIITTSISALRPKSTRTATAASGFARTASILFHPRLMKPRSRARGRTSNGPEVFSGLSVLGQVDYVASYDQILAPPDTWFTQELIADGNRIVIKRN